jgi:hypothetical protein
LLSKKFAKDSGWQKLASTVGQMNVRSAGQQVASGGRLPIAHCMQKAVQSRISMRVPSLAPPSRHVNMQRYSCSMTYSAEVMMGNLVEHELDNGSRSMSSSVTALQERIQRLGEFCKSPPIKRFCQIINGTALFSFTHLDKWERGRRRLIFLE